MFDGPAKYPSLEINSDNFPLLSEKPKITADTREKIVVLAEETNDEARDLYEFFLYREHLEDVLIRVLENGLVEFTMELPPETTPNKIIETRTKLERVINSIEELEVINDGTTDKVA